MALAAKGTLDRLGHQYRATGVVLLGLETDERLQLDLFREGLKVEKLKKVYASVDKIRDRYVPPAQKAT